MKDNQLWKSIRAILGHWISGKQGVEECWPWRWIWQKSWILNIQWKASFLGFLNTFNALSHWNSGEPNPRKQLKEVSSSYYHSNNENKNDGNEGNSQGNGSNAITEIIEAESITTKAIAITTMIASWLILEVPIGIRKNNKENKITSSWRGGMVLICDKFHVN